MKDKPTIEDRAFAARSYLLNYLSEVAEEKKITQQQIADHTGMERSNINRIFSGKYSPSLDKIIKICDAIGVLYFITDKNRDDLDLVKMMKERHKRKGDFN